MKILLNILLVLNSWQVLASADKSEFSGIISLDQTGCSASLVRLKEFNIKNALVLTNGHCLGGYIEPNKTIINLNLKKPKKLYTGLPTKIAARLSSGLSAGLFDNNGILRTSIDVTRIVYATMTKTDIALIELNKTYKEIRNRYGIEPYVLSQEGPGVGENIIILSGYGKKKFKCSIENIAGRVEESKWYWLSSIGYSEECNVQTGTSGSPIISERTGEVIGVNNSVNQDGNKRGKACSLNNPCEVFDNGEVIVKKGKGYGQNTHWIYDCLSHTLKNRVKFNPKRERCLLPFPRQE